MPPSCELLEQVPSILLSVSGSRNLRFDNPAFRLFQVLDLAFLPVKAATLVPECLQVLVNLALPAG